MSRDFWEFKVGEHIYFIDGNEDIIQGEIAGYYNIPRLLVNTCGTYYEIDPSQVVIKERMSEDEVHSLRIG